jgi:hypothetical protein
MVQFASSMTPTIYFQRAAERKLVDIDTGRDQIAQQLAHDVLIACFPRNQPADLVGGRFQQASAPSKPASCPAAGCEQ